MELFEAMSTQRSMRRLKADAVPDAVIHRILDLTICAPSGGNRQGWSFVIVRDPAKRARLGELYREAWGELMKAPYYAGASQAPPDSREGRMLASARHLSEHLGEVPVLRDLGHQQAHQLLADHEVVGPGELGERAVAVIAHLAHDLHIAAAAGQHVAQVQQGDQHAGVSRERVTLVVGEHDDVAVRRDVE